MPRECAPVPAFDNSKMYVAAGYDIRGLLLSLLDEHVLYSSFDEDAKSGKKE